MNFTNIHTLIFAFFVQSFIVISNRCYCDIEIEVPSQLRKLGILWIDEKVIYYVVENGTQNFAIECSSTDPFKWIITPRSVSCVNILASRTIIPAWRSYLQNL